MEESMRVLGSRPQIELREKLYMLIMNKENDKKEI